MTKADIEKYHTKQAILFMCRLTFKSLAIGLALTYGFLYIFLNVKSAEAATLKPEAVINDNVVKISDLFDDIPQKKDVVVGNAPAPGKSIVLNAITLKRIASLYDLKWESSSPSDQITIRRTEQTIAVKDITALLKKDLTARGVSGDFDVSLNNVAPTIILPGNVPATAEISQMNYVPGRDVFSAVIAAPSAANPLKILTISGLIEKTTQVPVLSSALKSGDIVGSGDIQWIAIPNRNMLRDTIVDADHLIGKTPARMADAGVPLRDRDMVSPQLVARGDEVLLQFNQGGLQLTAKGKAMQNGTEGEFIRVMNLSSNQSLRGEVTGNKVVSVQ